MTSAFAEMVAGWALDINQRHSLRILEDEPICVMVNGEPVVTDLQRAAGNIGLVGEDGRIRWYWRTSERDEIGRPIFR